MDFLADGFCPWETHNAGQETRRTGLSALTPAEKAELDGDVQSNDSPLVIGLHDLVIGATKEQMRAAYAAIGAANPQTAVLQPTGTHADPTINGVSGGTPAIVAFTDEWTLLKTAQLHIGGNPVGARDVFSLIGYVEIGSRMKRVWRGAADRSALAGDNHVFRVVYAVGDKDNAGAIALLEATTTAQQARIEENDDDIAAVGRSADGLRRDVNANEAAITPLQVSTAMLVALLPVVENVTPITGGLQVHFTDTTTSPIMFSTDGSSPDIHATGLRFGAINASTGVTRLFIERSDGQDDIFADFNISPYVQKAIRDYTELNDLNFSSALTPEQQDNILRKIGAQEAPDDIPAAAELEIEALADTGEQSRLLTGEIAIVPRKRGHALSGNINITDGVRLRTSAVPDPRATLHIEIGGVLVDFTAELQSINAVGDVVNRDGVWDGCIPQRDRGQPNLNDAANGSSFNALMHFNPHAPIVIWITLTGGTVRLSNSRDSKIIGPNGEVIPRAAFGSGFRSTTDPDTGVVTYTTDVEVTQTEIRITHRYRLPLIGASGSASNANINNRPSSGAGERGRLLKRAVEAGNVKAFSAFVVESGGNRAPAPLSVDATYRVIKSTDNGATFVSTGAELTIARNANKNDETYEDGVGSFAKGDIVGVDISDPASGNDNLRTSFYVELEMERVEVIDLNTLRLRGADFADRILPDATAHDVGQVPRIINPGPGGKEWGVGPITAAPASVVLGGQTFDLSTQETYMGVATNINVPDPAVYRSFKVFLSEHSRVAGGHGDSPAIEFLTQELSTVLTHENGDDLRDSDVVQGIVSVGGNAEAFGLGRNAANKIVLFLLSESFRSAAFGLTIIGVRELDSLNIHGDFNSLRRTNIPTTPGANPQNTFALTGLSVAADDTPRKFYLKIQSDTGTTHNKAIEPVAVDRDDLLGILPANRAQIGQTFNAVNSFAYPDQRDGLTMHIGVDTNDQLIISGVTRPLLVEMFEDRLRFVGNA